jgi:hypothetical protein
MMADTLKGMGNKELLAKAKNGDRNALRLLEERAAGGSISAKEQLAKFEHAGDSLPSIRESRQRNRIVPDHMSPTRHSWAGRWSDAVDVPGPAGSPGLKSARPGPVQLAVLDDSVRAATNAVVRSMKVAPQVTSFRQLAERLVMCIHTVGRVMNVGLDQLEIYVGRSSWTAGHVLCRWDEHRDKRQHTGAMVVARCQKDEVESWERGLILLYKGLQRRGELCVANLANVKDTRAGNGPATPIAPVYLTWKTVWRSEHARFPSPKTCREVALEVERELRNETPPVERTEIEPALQKAQKPDALYLKDIDWVG